MTSNFIIEAIALDRHLGSEIIVNINSEKLAEPLLHIFNTLFKAVAPCSELLHLFTLGLRFTLLLVGMLLEATIIQFLAVVALFEQGIETAVMHTFLFHHANSRLKVAFIASLIAQLLLELSTNHVAALKIRILSQNFVEVAQGELVLLGVDEKHRALVECHKVALG